MSFHSTSNWWRSAAVSSGSSPMRRSGSATMPSSRRSKCRAMRSMVASSNKSVQYSQIACSPCSVSRSDQREIELGAVSERVQAAHLQALELELATGYCQHERDLEQRIAAQIAARAQAPRPASRRAGPGAHRPPARASRTRASSSRKRRVAREGRPQHQRVHENADQPLEFGALAPGNLRAHRDVLCAAVAMEQNHEGRQQRHEQRRAFGATQRRQPPTSSPGSATTSRVPR